MAVEPGHVALVIPGTMAAPARAGAWGKVPAPREAWVDQLLGVSPGGV